MQTLLELDCSSPGFPDHLSNILGRREFEECVGKLELNDVVRVIECLDKVPTFRHLESRCAEPIVGRRNVTQHWDSLRADTS